MIHDLRRGERVIVLLRRHPAALLTALAWPLLLLAMWAVSLLFVAPFIAMGFGWLPFRGSPRAYVLWYIAWMMGFFIVIGVGMWRLGRAST